MKLDEFANSILGSSNQTGNLWDHQKFNQITDALGGIDNANPILTTTTWQTILESPDFLKLNYPKAVNYKAKYSHASTKKLEKYLLCLGNKRFCLLVFDPNLTTDEPIHIDASQNNSQKSLNTGFKSWQSKMDSSKKSMQKLGYNTIFELHKERAPKDLKGDKGFLDPYIFKQQIVDYGVNNSEWPMIICKPPKKVMTCFHSKNAHKVYLKEGEKFKSLAGIYTKNKQGDFGVTICLHSFPDNEVELGKTKVSINGFNGVVVSVHQISDSCFVKLDATKEQITDLMSAKGPLQGTSPREFEKCFFTNKEGDQIETLVIGWSPDILYFEPFNQVKVLTHPITNPGDSGSALMDSSKNVLGFSFYRTEINAVKEFSAWIWAASVFKAHKLAC